MTPRMLRFLQMARDIKDDPRGPAFLETLSPCERCMVEKAIGMVESGKTEVDELKALYAL